ncbi:zinc finger protein 771-like [Pollicipes pollicipes]|uniref:zinc finger protein 771-like n=1 Tax=Pollicipes pollicipes TaxID=41117 RepID=UPI001884945D|nr:zinc finger protein 771-like [Pollicipes pollicipes]
MFDADYDADEDAVSRRPPHGQQRLSCGTCGRVCRCAWELRRHSHAHTGARPELCRVCGRGFAQRPFACATCGKRFRWRRNLTSHALVHSDESPHVCDVCGARFSGGGVLAAYVRIPTGEKPHACDVCGRPFRHRGTLKAHPAERPPRFACVVCDKVLQRQRDLDKHAYVHEDDDFRCGV